MAAMDQLVWIWPRDPALADPARMPDFHWNDGTDWVGEGSTLYKLVCDYRLVVDSDHWHAVRGFAYGPHRHYDALDDQH
jgi:phenylpropionate dioxygenase-like ring-hydroxylating dioxygenase large terminal subunit